MVYKNLSQSDSQFYHFPDVGTYAEITQHCDKELMQLTTTRPMLIQVLQGVKQIQVSTQRWELYAGESVLILADQTMDIINLSCSRMAYRACWFSWEPELINQYKQRRQTNLKSAKLSQVQVLTRLPNGFQQSIDYLAESFKSSPALPENIVQHRLSELLCWLDSLGIYFSDSSTKKVQTTLRHLFSQSPDKKWLMSEVCQKLAMSEATLRRRLQDDRTSLTEILTDVRMSYGLTLLQTTRWPVNQIALASGYESASRFSVRFRKRFGFSPMKIRGRED